MSTLIEILLFVHLLAVATLFFATGIEVAAFVLLRRATSIDDVRAAMAPRPLIGPIMGASAGVLILAGLGMAVLGRFGSQPWIVTGLIVAIALSVNGPVTNGKRMERIDALAHAAPPGPITAEIQSARCDRFLTYSVGALFTLLACMLYVMSNKPMLPGCIAAIVVALLLPAVPALAVRRSNTQTAPAEA